MMLIFYMSLIVATLIGIYIYQERKLKTISAVEFGAAPIGVQFDTAELSKRLIREWEKDEKRFV